MSNGTGSLGRKALLRHLDPGKTANARAQPSYDYLSYAMGCYCSTMKSMARYELYWFYRSHAKADLSIVLYLVRYMARAIITFGQVRGS